MNRRGFLAGLAGATAALVLPPQLVVPERRYWSLDGTMVNRSTGLFSHDAIFITAGPGEDIVAKWAEAAKVVREMPPFTWSEMTFARATVYTFEQIDALDVYPTWDAHGLSSVSVREA